MSKSGRERRGDKKGERKKRLLRRQVRQEKRSRKIDPRNSAMPNERRRPLMARLSKKARGKKPSGHSITRSKVCALSHPRQIRIALSVTTSKCVVRVLVLPFASVSLRWPAPVASNSQSRSASASQPQSARDTRSRQSRSLSRPIAHRAVYNKAA
jgi:hypothetical protein